MSFRLIAIFCTVCFRNLSTSTFSVSSILSDEPCRKKLMLCGSFQIRTEMKYIFLDNRNLGANQYKSKLTYLVLAGDSFLNGTAEPFSNSSIQGYIARFNITELGIHVLALYLDNVQIPNSPFLFAVTKRSCSQFQGKISDLLGDCVCADIATFDIGGHCVSVIVITIAGLVAFFLIIGTTFCIRKLLKTDEDETRKTVEDLRIKLHLTHSEGIILSSDLYPIWRHPKSLIFIQRSYLEAAARLALFRDDCDVKLLNGLCVCLLERPEQYNRFCEWLLCICRNLLDVNTTVPLKSYHPNPNVTSSWATSKRMGKNNRRKVQSSYDSRTIKQEGRYRYFVEKVCKIQVLRDDNVFDKLQQIVQNIMDKLAGICDSLFDVLSAERDGAELLSSRFTDVAEDPSAVIPECSIGELLFSINDKFVFRQDSEEVSPRYKLPLSLLNLSSTE